MFASSANAASAYSARPSSSYYAVSNCGATLALSRKLVLSSLKTESGISQAIRRVEESLNWHLRVRAVCIREAVGRRVIVDTGLIDKPYQEFAVTELAPKWVRKVKPFFEKLGAVLAAINLALGIICIYEAHGARARLSAVMRSAAGAAETLGALAAIGRAGSATLGTIAAVGGVLEMVVGALQFDERLSWNDYDGAFASMGVVLGAGLTVVGGVMMRMGAVGAETGWGLVLLFVGALVTAAGFFAPALAEDTPIETFLKHCVWGKYSGTGEAKPEWAGAPLHAWADDLEAQVSALFNLMYAFKLETEPCSDGVGVSAQLPMLTAGTRLYVDLQWQYAEGYAINAVLMVDFAQGGQVIPLVPTYYPLDLSTSEVEWEEGRATVRIRARLDPFPYGLRLANERSPMKQYSAAARLNLNGDGKHMVPSSGNWVQLEGAEAWSNSF